MHAPTQNDIRQHLEALLASHCLSKSPVNQKLLGYLVQRSISGADGPKETEIAIDVFGRDASFNGGDDSVVRVAMRGLRQKLREYYSGPGRNDSLAFDIPKGSYRLTAIPRDGHAVEPAEAAPPVPGGDAGATRSAAAARGVWAWAAAAATVLLCLSLALNLRLWSRHGQDVAWQSQVRGSLLWKDIATSARPVMFVLGDLFMYTQRDPVTGRIQTVRDPQINSSDDLRAFLASRPELAAERGLRYASYIQKSTAASMAAIIPLVGDPQRAMEVRLRDELRADDLQQFDIVYLGPISRIGPLGSSLHGHSRFRFDAPTSVLTNIGSGEAFHPEGDLGGHHTDYALLSRFKGPAGNNILIITAGGRNAGLQQVVRAVTSADGLEAIERRLRESGTGDGSPFEALISVTGYKQTDLSASIVDVYTISAAPLPAQASPASAPATTAQAD